METLSLVLFPLGFIFILFERIESQHSSRYNVQGITAVRPKTLFLQELHQDSLLKEAQ